MKLWIDDVRPAPEGYVWCKSVNEAIDKIVEVESNVNNIVKKAKYFDSIGNYGTADHFETEAANSYITLIDIDHDSGVFFDDGGDYIRLLDWLEKMGKNYPIRIHSMNPV